MADEKKPEIQPELLEETPQDFVMSTGEEKKISSILTPKMPKRFSKRIAVILAAALTGVFLIIGMSARSTTTSNNRTAGNQETQPLSMASAERSIDVDKRIIAASAPIIPPTAPDAVAVPAAIPIVPEPEPISERTETRATEATDNRDLYRARREEMYRAALEAERERQQQHRALSEQFVEHQRQTFLSSPATGGTWQSSSSSSAASALNSLSPAEARRAQHEQRREAFLSSYSNALNAAASGAGGSTASAAEAATANTGRAQTEKEQFFNAQNSGKGVLPTLAQAPISPYLIPSGTMIPCNLVIGINSDLPGYVVAQVSENVCDWKNPDIILIPQGTRVFGQYDSKVAFAQRRVQVSWSRLIYPDGTTLDLQGMPGADKKGYSGLSDKYYPRYGRMLTAAIMTAAFSSVGLLFDDSSSNYTTVTVDGSTVVIPNDNEAMNEFAAEVAETIGDMGEKLFDKYLNSSPTIQIRPAKRFSIVVNADIPFFTAYGRVR